MLVAPLIVPPLDAVQLYEPPPLAVRVVVVGVATHTVKVPEIDAVGFGLTTTFCVVELVHPWLLVAVNVTV